MNTTMNMMLSNRYNCDEHFIQNWSIVYLIIYQSMLMTEFGGMFELLVTEKRIR